MNFFDIDQVLPLLMQGIAGGNFNDLGHGSSVRCSPSGDEYLQMHAID
jgi:hypothetical protein